MIVGCQCHDYNQSCPRPHQGRCNRFDQLITAKAPAPTPDTDPGAGGRSQVSGQNGFVMMSVSESETGENTWARDLRDVNTEADGQWRWWSDPVAN